MTHDWGEVVTRVAVGDLRLDHLLSKRKGSTTRIASTLSTRGIVLWARLSKPALDSLTGDQGKNGFWPVSSDRHQLCYKTNAKSPGSTQIESGLLCFRAASIAISRKDAAWPGYSIVILYVAVFAGGLFASQGRA